MKCLSFHHRLVLAMLLLATAAIAQPRNNPEELQAKLKGKTTLKAIMREVDAYYKEEPEETFGSADANSRQQQEEEGESNYLQWKRWEWYMSSRLGPNGEFVNINEKMWQAYEQDLQRDPAGARGNGLENLSNISTGSWAFVGPTNYGTVWGGLPGNGRVDRLAFDPADPNIVYAGTPAGGLWRTYNGGTSWTPLSNYMATLGVAGIVVDRTNASTIYVLTGDGETNAQNSIGVVKSTDGGQTWQRTGQLGVGTDPFAAYRLVQSPSNANTLLAATSRGVFRTTNGGGTWTLISYSSVFNDVKYNPLNSNTIYAAGPGNYIISNDGGNSFNFGTYDVPVNTSSRIEIAVSANDTTKVYLLCSGVTASQCKPTVINAGFKGIYRSLNGGRNFTRVRTTPNILGSDNNGNNCDDQSGYDLCITASPVNANFLVIAGMSIWTSNNGGVENYSSILSGLTHVAYYWGGPNENVHPDIHGVVYNPLSNKLYACTDGGLYVSSNNGTNWTYISDGLNTTQWYHCTSFPNDRSHLVGGLQDNGIRNRATLTSAFNHVASGDGFTAAYDPNNSSRFYSIINTGGYRWVNDGATYTGGYEFTNFFPFVGRHPTNTNIVFAGREDSIFKSSDEGSSFIKQKVGGNRRIIFCPSDPNVIYAANSSKIWRSGDGGSTWADLSLRSGYPTGSPTITCAAVNPVNSNELFISFGGYVAGIKVFYMSYSATSGWANDGADLPNLPVNSLAVNTDNSVYCGTDDGVFYQSPTSYNWLPFYDNLPRVPVTDLMIFNTSSDQYIYAATYGRGLWFSGLKQACDPDISLSGSTGGQQFYQATNTITSSQTAAGGNGTQLMYRGGTSVTLTPGFEAKEGNEMKAFLGPCDTYGVPVFRMQRPGTARAGTDSLFHYPSFRLAYDSALGTTLPYGYVTLSPQDKAAGNIRVTIKQAGEYKLVLTNSSGQLIENLWTATLAAGNMTNPLHLPAGLPAGTCYLALYHGDKLAHFLEWRIN